MISICYEAVFLAFCFTSNQITLGLRISVYGPVTSSHFFYIIKHDIDNNRECPGKSFGLKFIPNQSDLFRNVFPRQSELIRVNPKKVFNLVWCNSVKNQSVSIRVNPRLWIQMNPDQSFNPHESEVRILRIDSDWVFRLNHSDLGFIWIKNFFRIHLDWQSRNQSDWFGLNFG